MAFDSTTNADRPETETKVPSIDNLFDPREPDAKQLAQMAAVRMAAKVFAKTVIAFVPRSADRTVAIRKIGETVMCSNRAVMTEGLDIQV